MSIDKTLRMKDSLIRHRNVLTRAQRIEELERQGRWSKDENSPFKLPKVRVLKAKRDKKKKKEEEGAAATTPEAPGTSPPAE